MNDMQVSQNGINLIKQFEGLRLTAYNDGVGVPTIGYGHTKGVKYGTTITQKQADQFLIEDVNEHIITMKQLITTQLNQNQFDALASFHFNLGRYILVNDKTLLRNINNRSWDKVSSHLLQYSYGGGRFMQGLYNRRVKEVALFNTPVKGITPVTPTKGGIKLKRITLKQPTNLRKSPSTVLDNKITTLGRGDVVEIVDIIESNGYVWGIQNRADGSKGYITIASALDHVVIS